MVGRSRSSDAISSDAVSPGVDGGIFSASAFVGFCWRQRPRYDALGFCNATRSSVTAMIRKQINPSSW
jgi:hypothetical protein